MTKNKKLKINNKKQGNKKRRVIQESESEGEVEGLQTYTQTILIPPSPFSTQVDIGVFVNQEDRTVRSHFEVTQVTTLEQLNKLNRQRKFKSNIPDSDKSLAPTQGKQPLKQNQETKGGVIYSHTDFTRIRSGELTKKVARKTIGGKAINKKEKTRNIIENLSEGETTDTERDINTPTIGVSTAARATEESEGSTTEGEE
jgi:hypothetical protein